MPRHDGGGRRPVRSGDCRIWWRGKPLPASHDLLGYGAPFDRNADGSLALGREAAHSLPRIVHVKGDGAGAAISAHPGGARR